MSFPFSAIPINKTSALVLQKSKEPENDYEECKEKLDRIKLTRRQILATPNSELRVQQLKDLGQKEQAIIRKIQKIKLMLKKTKPADFDRCFVEICFQKMPRVEFDDISRQACELSYAVKEIEKLKEQNNG